jgi:imidazolonepropionase-like amidohydrolase
LRIIAPLAALLCAQWAVAAAQPRVDASISHVTVIDTVGGVVKPDQTVVIANGRIAAVGAAATTTVPAGTRVIDGRGKFLIPGLWDMHVHLLWEPALEAGFPLCVANGVTGVRDMHTHVPFDQVQKWRREVEAGERVGPRFVFAGPIVDGRRPIWPGSVAAGDAATARKAVRDLKASRVDFVKVYEGLSREAYFAIADEAKNEGIPFAGHVPGAVTPAEASDAGQRSIEHLSHLLDYCQLKPGTRLRVFKDNRPGAAARPDDFGYDDARGQALFAKFKANHTWHCPTLITAETTTFGREDRIAKDPRRKYLAPSILAKVGFDDSGRDYDATLRFWREERKLFRRMHEAGVPLLAGTDAPVVRNVPGFTLHDELKALVDAGLTPLEALRAATMNPARFLGLEKEMGSIEVGKIADLVLLNADPIKDIGNTTRIDAVIVNARFYDRAAIDELLSDLLERARREKSGM